MTERRHDVVRACAGIGEKSSKSLSKPMRTAIEGKSSLGHRVAHPSTESINGEWLAPFRGQDTNMFSRKRLKSGAQRKSFFYDDRNSCFAPRILKIIGIGLYCWLRDATQYTFK
jgi:hypothetical protein